MKNFQKRPFLTILISIIAAYLSAFFIPNNAKLWIIVIVLSVLVILVLIGWKRKFFILTLLPFAFAMLNHYLFMSFAYLPMQQFQGEKIEIQGKVISSSRESTNASYFTMRPDAIILDDEIFTPNGNVVIYTEKGLKEFAVGSKISCLGTVFEEDDEFSINYRATRGQFLSIYVTESKLLQPPDSFDIYVITENLKSKVVGVYNNTFSSSAAAMINGITLGDTDAIDRETYSNFRNSGVSHTMAVSGMHLSFLTSLVWYILAAVCPNLRLRCIIELIIIWMFTALTGFSPSCCRAAIMLSVFQFGILIDKESDTFTSLAFAVVICCLRNPLSILNPSLALSATATLGILLFGGPIQHLLPAVKNKRSLLGRFSSFVSQTISMSVAATIGTLPVMALIFKSMSLLAPLTNVLIIPIIESLFFLGFASIALGWIAPMAKVLYFLADWMSKYCRIITAWVARLPFSTVFTGTALFWAVLIVIVIIFVAVYLLLRARHKSWILPCYLVIFMALIGVSYLYDFTTKDNIGVNIVNVQQGNTAMIYRGHEAIMVDCGGSGTGYQEISEQLLRSRIKKISAIYITHLDADHIRYVTNLLNSYSIDELYLPQRAEYSPAAMELFTTASARSTNVTIIGDDRTFNLWGLAKLKVYSDHLDPLSDDENENSLVYQLIYNDTEVLFTGDVESDGEQRLVSSYRSKLASDIVVIAHHGSNGSSKEEFLDYVNAQIAVISVGEENTYGLPNENALKRIRKYISTILRTDQIGSITFILNENGFQRKV